MTLDWIQGSLAEGLRLYEAGEFFAAHEARENRWLESQEPEKTFLQGLIQVTAAFHHLQRNNPLGTTRLLRAALRRRAAGNNRVVPSGLLRWRWWNAAVTWISPCRNVFSGSWDSSHRF